MNLFCASTTIFLIGLVTAIEIQEEENAPVLTKDNFDEAVKLCNYLLVEYYAP